MQLKKLSVLLIVISLLVTGCYAPGINSTETTLAPESIAPVAALRAEDDYYGYINLETLQNITLEYGETQAGSFSAIDIKQQLLDSTSRVVNSSEEFPEGSCEQIIHDAYLQYIDFQADDAAKAEACQEVEAMLRRISDVQTLDELIAIAGELKVEYGCDTFSALAVDMNNFNPGEYGLSWSQTSGLCGVSLEKVDENSYLAKEYEKRIIDTLQVMGKSYSEAEEITQDLMLLIIDVAWATDFEIANSTNPYAYVSFMTNAEIDAALSSLSSKDYEQMSGIQDNPYGGWLVMDKGQLTAIDSLYKEENVEELKAWAAYDFLAQYGAFITSEYSLYEEYFPTSHETLDLQALKYIDNAFPSVLSDLYVKDYYTEEMDQQFSQMCEDVRESYRDLITNSEWLSQEARQLLLQKLDNIKFVTGGFCLEQMKDDPGVNEVFGDNTYETLRNVAKNKVQKAIDNIGQPRDRLELGMPMHMVNACYNLDNTVTITVAIMSAPFFDVSADYFTNLGGLGIVVAHEVGHAFDSNMILCDENGVYDPTWLPASDMTALEERDAVAVEYFEKYFTVFDVYHVDGELTLGENYADLGGMECITNIARTEEDYVKLFENYARIWCELGLNTDVIEQLAEDPHSPTTIRVNAILATTEAFCEVYGLKEGDGMYVAPENRISRWK
jgi:predicted metalloendopeptidase